MLVSREVGNDVETFLLTEDTFKDWICEIECVATELPRYKEAFSRANIANEFCKSILIKVNDYNRSRFESENRLDEVGVNRSGTTYHTYFITLTLSGKSFLIFLNICCNHTGRTRGH